ncbi:MAG: sodium/proline symporter PutP [Treponema sp.]|nr:sodium/proline symporter PutP [Treponema sp.]MDY2923625.1 sodium/proline symporter PutP [Treponema sp.]MDY5682364.1 sodium/proline symporter PutP [Treponema sp.]
MNFEIILRFSAFVLYLMIMVFIGLKHMSKNNNSSDFFLGGRKIGPWMTALSAEASDMSGWLLMGLPGVAYLTGQKEAFWTAVGLEIGTYLNWLFVAKPLRNYTALCGNAITIPQFLTNRFKDKSHVISFVSVIFILIFFTVYTASSFVSCGKLINSVFGVPYFIALLIGIAVILTYTLLGGFLAVCSTDFIQGTLMFFALIITTIIMIFTLGGPAETFTKVSTFGSQFLNPFVKDNTNFGLIDIASSLAWGLGYFGMPHILVRFMSIRSDKDIKLSRRIAMVWVTIAFMGALFIGAVAKAYLAVPLEEGKQETVVIASILQTYPAFIGGIFLCAILAAAMSTADSQLLVAASAFSEDVYRGFMNKEAEPKKVLQISRITVLIIGLVAFFLSIDPNNSIFSLVSYAWAGFGATFGPLILLSLFWRGTTKSGALSGLVAGGVTVIVWHQLKGGIFNLYELAPGFLVCLAVAIVVSLLDKEKDPEVLKEFDEFKKACK